jgi:CheY-like chemotaxis protein
MSLMSEPDRLSFAGTMSATPPLLLCSTDPATRHMIELGLGRNYALSFAETTEAAVTEAASSGADVIFCDLTDASLSLLEVRSDAGDAPVVLFAFEAATPLVARAYEGGAAHCVSKPVELELLRVLLRRCLRERTARATADRAVRRVHKELADARRIQHGMMPAADRRVGGASVAARWQPSAELGGDLLDFVEAGPSCVALLIADVAGHGVPAALLTTLIKAAFRSSSKMGFAPAGVACAVAESLAPFGADRFVTLVSARLDAARHTVEYLNAGHPPPLIFHRGQTIARLEPTGPLIGSGVSESTWDAATTSIPSNSGVLLYTDGVIEARGDSGRFGAERLADAVARRRAGGGTLLDDILASVSAFSAGRALEDDLTLLTASVGLPGLA